MELIDFLTQTQAEVQEEVKQRLQESGALIYLHQAQVFSEIVMGHMSEFGMTNDPELCHFEKMIGGANLKLSGYAVSDDATELDLFVSLYQGTNQLVTVTDAETTKAAEQCLRFLSEAAAGRLIKKIEEDEDAYPVIYTIQSCYGNLDQIRVFVLTDKVAKSKNFRSREVAGKTVKLEIMDIERLHRHWSEGKPRDELIVRFDEVCGTPLPCVWVPGEMSGYDYALTAIPGNALNFIYEKYGARLLEANVRSFLSVTGKVNRGIRDTLKDDPERFMAYNNGVVIVADEAQIEITTDGGPGILWLKGMQIVNGGQTTASIYFSKKKNPSIDLRKVRVPAKIIILKSTDSMTEEGLISDISKFANSQNSVKQSDLSANKPFHVELEKLSLATYCPDGIGRWFYERAAGSYNVMLAREGTSPARLKAARDAIPSSRKITKTDLAKFLNAWRQKPHLVSLGSQKNFDKFMAEFAALSGQENKAVSDANSYKEMIAIAILYKRTHAMVRPMFLAFQGNVATYLISVLANQLGNRMDLEKIWLKQDISTQLKAQLQTWAFEVHDALQTSAQGRMISEWAKKEECWDSISKIVLSKPSEDIFELKQVN